MNSANVDSNSALTVAAMSGNLRMVEILLRNGANVNAKNNEWDTPLMKAADIGHYDTAKLLLNSGSDVNTSNKYGNTALMKLRIEVVPTWFSSFWRPER